MLQEALELDQARGDTLGAAMDRQSLAETALRAGRPADARSLLLEILPDVVTSGDAEFVATTLELSAAVCGSLGEHHRAARLAGAAEGVREAAAMPIPEPDAALLESFLAPVIATIPPEEWASELAVGRALSQEQALGLFGGEDAPQQHRA